MRRNNFRTAPGGERTIPEKFAVQATQKERHAAFVGCVLNYWPMVELLLGIVVGGFLSSGRVGCSSDRLHKGPRDFRSGDLAQQHGPECHVPAVNGGGGVGILLYDRAFQRESGKSALGA